MRVVACPRVSVCADGTWSALGCRVRLTGMTQAGRPVTAVRCVHWAQQESQVLSALNQLIPLALQTGSFQSMDAGSRCSMSTNRSAAIPLNWFQQKLNRKRENQEKWFFCLKLRRENLHGLKCRYMAAANQEDKVHCINRNKSEESFSPRCRLSAGWLSARCSLSLSR